MLTESPSRQASSSALVRMAALLAVLFALFAAAPLRADESPAGKIPPAGVFIYTILRDGEPVGQQRLELVGDGDKVRLIGRTDIDVKFLGLSLYGFNQQVEEVRAHGRILSLTSDAEDDGTDKQLRLTLQGELLKGSYNGKSTRGIDAGLVTSLFWQEPAIGAVQVIDCTKGKVRDVTVTDLGPATIDLPIGKVAARHIRVAGEIKRDLWYDSSGVLLAGELPAKDGSTIRSELLQRP